MRTENEIGKIVVDAAITIHKDLGNDEKLRKLETLW